MASQLLFNHYSFAHIQNTDDQFHTYELPFKNFIVENIDI